MDGFLFLFFLSQNSKRGIAHGEYKESVREKECLGEIKGGKSVFFLEHEYEDAFEDFSLQTS